MCQATPRRLNPNWLAATDADRQVLDGHARRPADERQLVLGCEVAAADLAGLHFKGPAPDLQIGRASCRETE